MTKKFGRDVEAIETWVRRGLAEGWVVRKPHALADEADDRYLRPRRAFVAELAMDCEEPYTVEVWGRYSRTGKQVKGIWVDVNTRCRKCQSCLDRKAKYWAARAMDEYVQSSATWMLTLTCTPEFHYEMDARMRQPLYVAGKLVRHEVGPFNGLASATLFRLRAREIGYEITKYLKRIRKERGAFRYLLVAERHMKDPNSPVFGRPHFHVLLHEQDNALVLPHEWQVSKGFCEADCKNHGRPLYHKTAGEAHDAAIVRTQWAHGWTKLVRCGNAQSALYVCKYVSKDPMARVRSSQGYGKNTL